MSKILTWLIIIVGGYVLLNMFLPDVVHRFFDWTTSPNTKEGFSAIWDMIKSFFEIFVPSSTSNPPINETNSVLLNESFI